MIRVDRSRVAEPDFFRSEEFRQLSLDLFAHHVSGGTRGSQTRFEWQLLAKSFEADALTALGDLFHGKCAYTEVPILPSADLSGHRRSTTGLGIKGSDPLILLHRPPADALGLDGTPAPAHYWWLITRWENWYLGMQRVDTTKGTQFPVAGERARPPTMEGAASHPKDLGLLLDPCEDEPAWFLGYSEEGLVVSREHPSPAERKRFEGLSRGEHTIRILDLNAPSLVASRLRLRRRLAEEVRELLHLPVLSLLEFVHPRRPFAGLRRQLVAEACAEVKFRDASLTTRLAAKVGPEITAFFLASGRRIPSKRLREELERRLLDEFPDASETRRFTDTFRRIGDLVGFSKSARRSAPSHARSRAQADPVIVHTGSRLSRIVIRNFKAVKNLQLTFSSENVDLPEVFGDSNRAEMRATGWKVFLGENGSGKSCILQAIGLGLAGEHIDDVLSECDLSWGKLIRRSPDGTKAKQGRVLLEFTGGARVDLRFNRNRHWWVGGEPRMEAFVRAYGATRLLDSADEESEKRVRGKVEVANLYDPRAPIIDAKRWLLSLDQGDFNVAALTIGDLLGEQVRVESQRPLLTHDDGSVQVGGDDLDLVSDGYRAVVGMLSDIIAGIGTGMSDLRNVTGIVLIDEIGAHLHPSWRMMITEKLRRALPNMQFIVSTHEPLCLRGLFGGEVMRVRKTVTHGVEIEETERSPSDYRVDQLLTSEFFGLNTTVDPELDRRFRRYYGLLLLEDAERTEENRAELRELEDYIRRHSNPVLGQTRRDQLVYDAIDEYLKLDLSPSGVQKRKRARKQALESVREIWERRNPMPRSPGGEP